LRVLRGHRPGTSVTDVVFSPDGRELLTTGTDADGRTWSVASGTPIDLLRGQFGSIAAGAFSPDGRWIVTAGPISAVLWAEQTGQLFFYLRGHTKRLTSISFSRSGTQVLTSSADGSIRAYECQICGDLQSLESLAERRIANARVANGS